MQNRNPIPCHTERDQAAFAIPGGKLHSRVSGPIRSQMKASQETRRWRSIAVLLFAAMLVAAAPARPIAAAPNYELEVRKSERLLLVKKGNKIEKTYRVATGRGGKGDKQMTGDARTPIGRYRIVRFNHNSKFHFFMQLNYPNATDAFYGLRYKRISRREFHRIIDALRGGRVPPQDTALGGFIGIHGIGRVNRQKLRIHSAADWTDGCIALTNEDIQDLRRYVSVGTIVVISD